MSPESESFAPYAASPTVVKVIRQLRDRGLPNPVNAKNLQRIGIPEGSIQRTPQTLRALGLVDDQGDKTERFEQIGRASTDEYHSQLAALIKDVYRDVFDVVDPSAAEETEIEDAFRHYQPQAQRSRMVKLFTGLCCEAGIIAGPPPEPGIRPRKAVRTKRESAAQSRPGGAMPNTEAEPEYMIGDGQTTTKARSDYRLLQGCLDQLPIRRKWSRMERERWLNAVTAVVDLLINIEEQEESLRPD